MITIRHGPTGPYVTRTIIEWNEWITETEAENRTAFLDDIRKWNETESPDTLHAEIDLLNDQNGDLEREYQNKIEALENDLNEARDLLEATDPGAQLRDEIARLTANLEALKEGNKTLARQAREADAALRNARARTCTVCGKWSDHDDRGICKAHGKPIKGLAYMRRKPKAA